MRKVFFDAEFCEDAGHPLLELALCEGDRTWCRTVHRPTAVPEETRRLTGIDNSATSEGLFRDEASAFVRRLLTSEDVLLVGYGIARDVAVLMTTAGMDGGVRAKFADCKTLACDWLCCGGLRDASGRMVGRSLDGTAQALGLKRTGKAHRALSDAMLCRDAWEALSKIAGAEAEEKYTGRIGMSDGEEPGRLLLSSGLVPFRQEQDVAHRVAGKPLLNGGWKDRLDGLLSLPRGPFDWAYALALADEGALEAADAVRKGASAFLVFQEMRKALVRCAGRFQAAGEGPAQRFMLMAEPCLDVIRT